MLAYCDKIADTVRKSLLAYDEQGIIGLIVLLKWIYTQLKVTFNQLKRLLK